MLSSYKIPLFSFYILIFTLCLQVRAHMPASKSPAKTDAAVATVMNASIAPIGSNADWWQEAVLYQIYPRSFMDSNADGVGDLKGIITKLPYLADTGITAIWLSPIFKSPMVDFGYDIADFKVIHEEYGTMQDFEELMQVANNLGIKVILDFVPNHTSDQCNWFKKSARRIQGYADFYVWADGKVNEQGERLPPNNWLSVFGGSAWTWHEERKQFYLHQFTVEQPDLNFRNAKVIEAMDEVLHFWLSKGVSGFRIDAVNHLFESPELLDEPEGSGNMNETTNPYNDMKHIHTKDLPEVLTMLQHWRQLLHDYSLRHADGPTRIMMTEAYADIKTLMNYYEDEAGVCGAHFPFNFLLITSLSDKSDARDYVFHIQHWLTYMPRGHFANWVLGNHDNPRVASRFGAESVDAMNMLVMTLPGVAVTYNGEEIGMKDYRDLSWEETVDPPARIAGPLNYKKVSRDPERTPFQWDDTKNAGFSIASKTWLPVHPNYKQLNLKQQMQTPKSHYHIYKALVELRKMLTLRKGRTHLEVVNRNVFAFRRVLKGHPTIITIINVGAVEQNINLTEIFDIKKELKVLITGTNSSYENGVIIHTDHLSLKAFEGLVCMLG